LLALAKVACASGISAAEPRDPVTYVPPAAHPNEAPNEARVEQVIALFHARELVAELLAEPAPTDLATRLHRDELQEQGLALVGRSIIEVDSVVASILDEQHEVIEARLALQAEQANHTTRYNILAIVIGGGLALVGTAMQLSDKTASPGDIVGAAGGASSVGFGLMALHASGTARMPSGVRSTMLARILDRPPAEGSDWPPEIWRYVSAGLAGQQSSYRDQLLHGWIEKGRISLSNSRSARAKIDRLTSPLVIGQGVDLDELADRAAMLEDAASVVHNMKRDLYDIVRYVREHRRAAGPENAPPP
jgi:hypothetical protein